MTDQLPLGELLCGEGVQYAITPTWVAELPRDELPAEPFRIYCLYCGHANHVDGLVWLRSLRQTVRRFLGCSERGLLNWETVLEGLGLITKEGRFGIRVHRRRDDIAEARKQNAALGRGRRRVAIPKPKRHVRAGPLKVEDHDEVPPLFRWADANRHDGAGSTTADTVDKSFQPARPCRSDDANRHDGAAQPARPCRLVQKSELKNSDSRLQAKSGNAYGASASDNQKATWLAEQYGVDLDLSKEVIKLERQVRMRLGSSVIVDIEQTTERSHPEGGDGYITGVIDSCHDRLEAEAIQAEGAGELNHLAELSDEFEEIPF
ncbi:MAG: hypothetical protein IIA72_06560 [Proteobacteria bacterium]|nr:hypothetical protein [Pseudomonadota bacterium]